MARIGTDNFQEHVQRREGLVAELAKNAKLSEPIVILDAAVATAAGAVEPLLVFPFFPLPDCLPEPLKDSPPFGLFFRNSEEASLATSDPGSPV